MRARLATVLGVLALASLPARAEDGPINNEVALRALAEAATVDEPAVFQLLGRLGEAATAEVILRESQSLPYVALSRLRARTTIRRDLELWPGTTYEALVSALAGGNPPADLRRAGGRLTLIHPKYVKNLSVQPVDSDWAAGEVSFAVPGTYTGNLRFAMHRRDGRWEVDSFELPAERTRVVPTSDGTWKLDPSGAERPRVRASAGLVVRVVPAAPALVPNGPTVLIPEVAAAERMPSDRPFVTIHASPSEGIWVDGREQATFTDLKETLRAKALGFPREASGRSRADVVLRVDGSLPWPVVQWVLLTLVDPTVKLDRTWFAVTHRASRESGAIPAFLPTDPDMGTPTIAPKHLARLGLFGTDGTSASATPEEIFAALVALRASAKKDTLSRAIEIDTPLPAGARVRFASVVATIDAARRAGFEGVLFVGAPPPFPKSTAAGADRVRDAIARVVAQPEGALVVKIDGHVVGSRGAATMPLPDGPAPSEQPERVVGTLAPPYDDGNDLPTQDAISEKDVLAKEPTVKDPDLPDPAETDDERPDAKSTAPAAAPRGEDDAVHDALRWLAAHQSPDGGWETSRFDDWCNGKPKPRDEGAGYGKPQYDVGVTGLAILAFLGAGYTNRSEGPFGKVVANGLRSLRNAQDAEGCIGARSTSHFVYNHAIGALAMVEAYGMTGSTAYKAPAQRALDFIARCRNPYLGWRYGVKPGDSDTSVTTWMTMPLLSARATAAGDEAAGKRPSLTVDPEAIEGARTWVTKMLDPDTGRAGYMLRGTGSARTVELLDRFPATKTEAMTASTVFLRAMLGEPAQSKAMRKSTALLENLLPTWNEDDGSIDMDYWYFGTLAMFQAGGAAWTRWESAMKPAIVDRQRKDGDVCGARGSWDPLDPWGGDGGRVYSTALMALCSEVYLRYDKVFGTSGPK